MFRSGGNPEATVPPLVSIFLCAVCCASTARAEIAVLTPDADTTLIETEPDNNLGGAPFINAGTTQNFTKNRALLRFDVAGRIPPGSLLQSASLTVEVTRQPSDGFTAAPFGLHLVLQPWGEGGKTAADPGHPGLGARAAAGEATWNHRLALSTATWAGPGGLAGVDFAAQPSAIQFIYGVGDSPYLFNSTADMAADAQGWLDHPEANFGWLLLTSEEALDFTARRFGSRESDGAEPLLAIEFLPPPRLEKPAATGAEFTFQFEAWAGFAYRVECRESLATGSWLTLSNVPPPTITTTAMIVDPLTAARRFFRVVRN